MPSDVGLIGSGAVTALLAGSLVLLLVTATLVVTTVGTASPVSFLLGVYVVAWTQVVGVALAVSAFDSFTRKGLLVASVPVFVGAVVVWVVADRPSPPSFRPAFHRLRAGMADPALLVLGTTLIVVSLYAVVLGVVTPQNEWDSLTYHLTRAAFWIQQGSVSYIPDVADIRVNGNPPNAEIGQAATILLGGSDRFVWLPSFVAVPALVLGVFGIARRAGLEPREALFGSLVFACLPLVVLQSSTAMNDLVVASFFVVATYFAIGTCGASAVGAALSLGLALGTKISAPLLMAIYLVVVLVARRRRVVEQLAIVILGSLLGGFWYALNFFHTRAFDGGMTEATGQSADRQPALIVTRLFQLFVDPIELPGATTVNDIAIYLGGGVILIVAAVIAASRGRRRKAISLGAAGAIVISVPGALHAEGVALVWLWQRAWAAIGREAPVDELSPFHLPRLADSSSTWFGPLGAILIIGGVVLVLRTRERQRRLLLALALSPLAFIIVLALNVPWDPWRGRFFVFPIALAAAAWSLTYRYRALTWAIVGVTVATVLVVVFNSYTKPPGIGLTHAPESVFGQPRWAVQTWNRRDDGTRGVVAFVERSVPPDASIGLALRQDDFSYPYFGTDLERSVRSIQRGSPAPADVDWIVEAPGHRVHRCASCWRTVLSTPGGLRVLRRLTAPSR